MPAVEQELLPPPVYLMMYELTVSRVAGAV